MFYRVMPRIICGSGYYSSSPAKDTDIAVVQNYHKSDNMVKVPNTSSSFWYAKSIVATNNPHYDKCEIYDALRGLYISDVLVNKRISKTRLHDLKFVGSYVLAKNTHNKFILIETNSPEHLLGQKIARCQLDFIHNATANQPISNSFFQKVFEKNQYIVAKSKYNQDSTNSIFKIYSLNRAYKACIADNILWICPNSKMDVYNIRDMAEDLQPSTNRLHSTSDIFCCGTDDIEQFVDRYYSKEYRSKFHEIKNLPYGGEITLDANRVTQLVLSSQLDLEPEDFPDHSFAANYNLAEGVLHRITFCKNDQQYDTVGYFTKKHRYYFANIKDFSVQIVDPQLFDAKMRSPKNYASIREFNNIQLLNFQTIDFDLDKKRQIGSKINFLG